MVTTFDSEVLAGPDMASILSAEPVMAYLKNMETMEVGGFYVNPTDLDKAVGAKWSRRDVLGMGNSPLSYGGTELITWEFSLVLNANYIQRKGKVTRTRAVETVKDYMAFLDSLVFPVQSNFPGWVGGTPPRVRFVWPGVVTASVRVASVKHSLEMFQRSLHMTHGTAKVSLIVDPRFLYWSDDVRYLGNDLV
ncbi:MAG: hypothetical protein Q7U75_02170 [Desulfobacterales bacterium]|nr:hypothetical protein [Desulfobacterales bacterium]